VHLRNSKEGDTTVVTDELKDDEYAQPRDGGSVRLRPFRTFHRENYVPPAGGLMFRRLAPSPHAEMKI
jgi:hypothetical protein